MITAFQIILLIAILLSVVGIIGEREDKHLRHNLVAVQFSSLAAFVITLFYF